jgi:hypothetical protein
MKRWGAGTEELSQWGGGIWVVTIVIAALWDRGSGVLFVLASTFGAIMLGVAAGRKGA